MPELPEVEIVTRGLRRRLRGRTICRVEVRDPKIKLNGHLTGQRIVAVRRRGKFIVFDLSGGRHLVVHLRMTGWFVYQAPAKYRFAIHTNNGTAYFADSRRFGTVEVLTASELVQKLAGLGPEPLRAGCDWTRLMRTARAIKVALLDQRLVAGVGNIYACEGLWRARIHPRRRACRLGAAELARLDRGVQAAMRKGIAYGPRIYDVQEFAVYARAGKPCSRCRTRVRRVVQAQRSTFFCPRCQR